MSILDEKGRPIVCSLTPPEAALPGHCDWCGAALAGRRTVYCSNEHRIAFYENHWWTWARPAALRRDHGHCVRGCGRSAHEVNHIAPRRGAGYGTGCHHHQDGLESLCHSCHVETTTAQLREWRPPKPRPEPRPRRLDTIPERGFWDFAA